jgi:4-alpha-glucanotransferase
LYAVLALESHRSRTVVVGEDLGTVPPGVRSAMRRHAVSRTWVFQTSLGPRTRALPATVPVGAVACVNTHDMVPLAGFLEARDIDIRVETGQLTAEEGARARSARARLVDRLSRLLCGAAGSDQSTDLDPLPLRLLRCALQRMSTGGASLVLVSLEDLLMETEPQNVPGTGPERPNWRRKIPASRAESEEAIRMLARWLRP